jgi:predicted nucleotidyltransferase component of viral defense system
MNPGFAEFLKASPQDRRDVFLGAAARLGTPEQNVEKDFWVTWTLDVLFNGLPAGRPRFLFKGGTSLSKAHGLISRFSEDIDITVFREDLGQAASVMQLEAMSRKKRQARLDAIKDSCCDYIQNTLAQQFEEITGEAFARMVKILEQPENQKSAMMDSSHERQSVRSSAGVCNGAGEPRTAPPERVPGCGESSSADALASTPAPVGSGATHAC